MSFSVYKSRFLVSDRNKRYIDHFAKKEEVEFFDNQLINN